YVAASGSPPFSDRVAAYRYRSTPFSDRVAAYRYRSFWNHFATAALSVSSDRVVKDITTLLLLQLLYCSYFTAVTLLTFSGFTAKCRYPSLYSYFATATLSVFSDCVAKDTTTNTTRDINAAYISTGAPKMLVFVR